MLKISIYLAASALLSVGLFCSVKLFGEAQWPVVSFGSPINLSDNPGANDVPKVASVRANVYVTWVDNTSGIPDVFFTRSTDTGKIFSAPINISQSSQGSLVPDLAVNEDHVFIVWINDPLGESDTFFSRSTNNGETFSAPANLSSNPGRTFIMPRIAASGERVYAIWNDNTPGRTLVAFVYSTDLGETFSRPVYIDTLGSVPSPSQLAVSGDNVYIAWQDSVPDIIFVSSHDGGKTFSERINLSDNRGVALEPRLAAVDHHVYVSWQDDTLDNGEIFFRRSTDGGRTFDATVNLSDNPRRSFNPEIITTYDQVYVAWFDFVPGETSAIYFSRSTDRGASFSRAINLSNSRSASLPAIAAIGHNLYVTWRDRTPGAEGLYFLFSGDSGTQHFSEPFRVAEVPAEGRLSAIENYIHVVWSQPVSPGNSDIFYLRGYLSEPR